MMQVGWKHRISCNEKFVQMKDPLGGLKNIELNLKKDYSYQDIKNLTVEHMRNKYNTSIFEEADIELGNYNNEIYGQFTDETGLRCDFWDFAFKIRQRNRHMKIYILTTAKDDQLEVKNNKKVQLEISEDKENTEISSKVILKVNSNKIKKLEHNEKPKHDYENSDLKEKKTEVTIRGAFTNINSNKIEKPEELKKVSSKVPMKSSQNIKNSLTDSLKYKLSDKI